MDSIRGGAWKRRLVKGLALFVVGCGAVLSAIPVCAPRFGRLPEGPRLERLKASPNYKDGEFRNQQTTPMFSGDRGRWATLWDYFFVRKTGLEPAQAPPMVKTDLKALRRDEDLVIWLGHSSSFLQLGGRRILIDPIFNDHAAPFSFFTRAFKGAYPYSAEDLPEIDCLIISHDHWDHLDYETLGALKPRIRAVVCPLGVGAHLERWGFAPGIIHEADWDEELRLEPGLTVHVLPARHFSGRWIRNNKTLWAGFLLETPRRRVFYSGDSGYGPHFARIGEKFGGVDLAIMENGQYDRNWPLIHMAPEEAARGAADLRARALLPVHAGRFAIANHAWDEPFRRILEASRGRSFTLLTPMIGEVARLGDSEPAFSAWWEAVDLPPGSLGAPGGG